MDLILSQHLFTAQHWCGAHTGKEAIWTESRVHLCGWAAETVCPSQIPHYDRGETPPPPIWKNVIFLLQQVTTVYILIFICHPLIAAIHLLLHWLCGPPHHHPTALTDPGPSLHFRHHAHHSLLSGRHPVAADLGRAAGGQVRVCDQAHLCRHPRQRVGQPYLFTGAAGERHGLPRAPAAQPHKSHL